MKSFCNSSITKGATRAAVLVLTMSSQALFASEADTTDVPTNEVYQLDGIVVVANSEVTPMREVGSSVTVITAQEIKKSQKQSVTEVLRTVPGLDVVQTGARGGQTSVFMRGANSGHTLVIVDGIEMNDPSSPNGAFDFADLSVDNIERIEVLRGSQSILYGSDAIGGVISIITRQGVGAPKSTFSADYGAYSTSKLTARTSGSNLRTSYSFSASRTDTKGFSATDSRLNNESDGFGLTSLSGKLVVRPSEFSQLRFVVRSSQSQTEIDKSFSSFTNPGIFDDINNVQDSRKSFLKAESDVTTSNDVLRVKAFATLANNKRTANDSPDPVFGPGFQSSSYDAETSHFGLKGVITPLKRQRLIVGVETERELLSQRTDFGFGASALNGLNVRTTGVYGLAQVNAGDNVFATFGVRNDNHDLFGSNTSFRATATFVIPRMETRFKASFGDGFNAPSLFQLFDPSFGNMALQPEESESWDVGIEQRFADDDVSVGVTWFHQSINNIFGFDPVTFRTINIAAARSEGAEMFAELRSGKVTARIDYTYTDAIDKADGSSLLRRARNKVNAHMTYTHDESTSAGFTFQHVGPRPDNNFEVFPAERISLESYTLVGLTAQRRIVENVIVTGRVENLLDEKYQEVLHYATSGRALYFGIRYSL